MTERAPNDRGREKRFFASLRMTMGGQNDKGKNLSFWGAVFSRSVILRSFAPKNLWDAAFGAGEKILRFAQNDNGGGGSE